MREAKKRQKDQNILVNLSGRGDKDLDHVLAWLKEHPGQNSEVRSQESE